jgi:adenine-specific DNA-methyltransferase
MQNLQNELIDLLKHEDNLVIDGHLNKNKIVELALKVEPQLISILIKNETFKKHFFQEVENVLVFDKIKFQRFVNNKSFLPDSYTAFKNKIGLITNDDDLDNFISTSNEVVLAWPHKDCVLEGGQTKEDQKRNEIFWNETLAPDSVDRLLDTKALTNFKKFDKDGEHKVTELKGNENLILKGNNLLALSSLLKTHRSKIKLIYIDPPFNTGNDSFQYNDTFNHSTWLTFMKNRLLIARQLLKEDGLIFINLDAIEDAYAKVLCDEIFGVANFVNVIAVKSSTPSGTKTAHKDKTIIKQKDLILVYRKSSTATLNPQYTVRDNWDKHYSLYLKKDSDNNYYLVNLIDVLIENNIISEKIALDKLDLSNKSFKKFYLQNSDFICRLQSHKNIEADKMSRQMGNVVYEHFKDGKSNGLYYNGQVITPLKQGIKKVYLNQKFTEDLGMLLCDFWWDIDFQNTQNEGGVSFPTAKKPELLISRIIELSTNENDIVLDYHLGSGTTAAVAMKSKRRYIGIEQMDYGENDSVKRLQNVINAEQSGVSKAYNWQGGGSFIYAELMQFNQQYIDLIQVAENKEKLINVWHEMQDTAFLSYQFDKKSFNERLDAFKTASIDDMKQYLIEVLDKNQLYVNYSEINDETFKVSQEDKELNKQFYSKK